MLKKISNLLLLPLFLLPACSGGPGSTNNNGALDPNLVFQALVANFMLPLYGDFAQAGEDLSEEAAGLCETPGLVRLESTQAAWRAAQLLLKIMEVLNFGPYEDLGLDFLLDFRPVREDNVEQALMAHTDFDQETLESLGSSVRGLPVLEYLLFDPNGDDQGILDSLSTDAEAETRCKLLVAVAHDVFSNAELLNQAWEPQGGNFSASLTTAGQGSEEFMSTQVAISTLVSGMDHLLEGVRDMKLGLPLGEKNGGTLQPDQVESPYSHHSLENIIANLAGWQALYLGSYEGHQGLGISDLVRDRSANLDDQVKDLFAQALAALELIPGPLSEAVVNQNGLVVEAEAKIKELRDVIRGPVFSLLGVSAVFSDNDGD